VTETLTPTYLADTATACRSPTTPSSRPPPTNGATASSAWPRRCGCSGRRDTPKASPATAPSATVLKAALPLIPRATGSVTLMSGYPYRKAEPEYSAFAAVNGAVEALVKSLTQELAPLRVNALAPGPVDTHAHRVPAEQHAAYRAGACPSPGR
jgi:Enoyl-(Acyl carrier protein) reductase